MNGTDVVQFQRFYVASAVEDREDRDQQDRGTRMQNKNARMHRASFSLPSYCLQANWNCPQG